MISIRTTALIAAMSVIGAVTPAAFGQGDVDNVNQSSTNLASVVVSGPFSSVGDVDIEQGACQQIAIATGAGFATVGGGSNARNVDTGTVSSAFDEIGRDLVGKDCS